MVVIGISTITDLVNNIPLRDAQPALSTNWFELTITCNEQVIFQNAWICDHFITKDNVAELASSAKVLGGRRKMRIIMS